LPDTYTNTPSCGYALNTGPTEGLGSWCPAANNNIFLHWTGWIF